MSRTCLIRSVLFASLALSLGTVAMAQLVLNNGGKVYVNGKTAVKKAFVVLNTPPATPIKTIGAGNGTILETEYSILKYNLHTGTTSITVPYMTVPGLLESFPLTVHGIVAGTETAGAGTIQFSSTHASNRAAGFDNLNWGPSYLPSDVTDMVGVGAGSNNSSYVIDRFWIIDAIGYSTRPGVTLDFTYINAEEAANGGNTINPANLQAQRWNNASGPPSWVDYFPAGTTTVNTPTASYGTVTNVPVPAADFYRSWTLVDNTFPLPLELTKFTGVCNNGHVMLDWETASENNTAYFCVEKSYNGAQYFKIGIINAAGNSNHDLAYSFMNDSSLSKTAYYRLREVDQNGEVSLFNSIAVTPCEQTHETVSIFQSSPSSVDLIYYSLSPRIINLKTYDLSGRVVITDQFQVNEGYNIFNINTDLAAGIYMFDLESSNKRIVKKVFITK